jgi:hypothetical protein
VTFSGNTPDLEDIDEIRVEVEFDAYFHWL